MKAKLIVTYGALAHEKEPRYDFCGQTAHTDPDQVQEEIWVEIPEEFEPWYNSETDSIVITIDGSNWDLARVIWNFEGSPVIVVPDTVSNPNVNIPLRRTTPPEHEPVYGAPAAWYTQPRHTSESPIARKRIERGLTQEQLAAKIGVDYRVVGTWERGEKSPRVGNLRKLATVLGCTMDELLCDED